MRSLLLVIVVAALGWSSYWFWAARAEERALIGWLSQQETKGWVAHAQKIQTQGFPNRLDSRLTELELADPATGLAWSAPFLDLLRLSYDSDHVIVVFPNSQVLATPNQKVKITAEDARASIVFNPVDAREVSRANLAAGPVTLSSEAGWTAKLQDLRAAVRPSDRVAGAQQIAVQASNLQPANDILKELASANLISDTIERLNIDASVNFDVPWSMASLDARPKPTAIDLHKAEMVWGPLELWAAGEVTVDSVGLLTGSVTIKAKNWRDMLDLAKAGGWVPEAVAGPLESGLELMAMLAGSPKTLDAPLTFKNGQMSFGPIPLGTAPRLRLR